MKSRNLIGTIALAVTLFLVAPMAEDTYDFRKTTWGMSVAQVEASEGDGPKWNIVHPNDRCSVLAYKTTFEELRGGVYYYFVDDQLIQSVYIFAENEADISKRFAEYETCLAKLTEDYGSPLQEKMWWKSPEYRNEYDSESWGVAISRGHLVKIATWETESTKIELSLAGNKGKAAVNIQYSSKALWHLEEEIRRTGEDY